MKKHEHLILAMTFIVSVLLLISCGRKMPSQDTFIEELLESNRDLAGDVLDNAKQHELRIIYTQINRDSLNRPKLKTFEYYAVPERYFYPASTVKLYAAALALEKLNGINVEGLNKFSSLQIDSAYHGQSAVETDSTAPNGRPTIAHYIKKIFLVSDNDAYNRLYEFLGQDYLNKKLWKKGFEDTRIFHRLSIALTPEENRHTNPFTFFNGDRVIYHQDAQYNPLPLTNDVPGMMKGEGHIEEGKLIREPMDFSQKNYTPLNELHGALQRLIFPQVFKSEQRFKLSEADYDFLLKYMSMLPGESQIAAYNDTSNYYDSYVKFFMFGDSKQDMPEHIRLFNKVGDAYGYLIDNAYIVDFKNKIEFFLSAVIFVNENQIFNDDQYEYDSIGFPFLANLGRIFYKYEMDRNRRYVPDLSRFKFDYVNTD